MYSLKEKFFLELHNYFEHNPKDLFIFTSRNPGEDFRCEFNIIKEEHIREWLEYEGPQQEMSKKSILGAIKNNTFEPTDSHSNVENSLHLHSNGLRYEDIHTVLSAIYSENTEYQMGHYVGKCFSKENLSQNIGFIMGFYDKDLFLERNPEFAEKPSKKMKV